MKIIVVFEKIQTYMKKSCKVFLCLSLIFLFVYLILAICFTLCSELLLIEAKNINIIALIAILFALPKSFVDFIDLSLNKKKKFKGEALCPHCHNRIEITFVEEDEL